jgi:hypothetical protein
VGVVSIPANTPPHGDDSIFILRFSLETIIFRKEANLFYLHQIGTVGIIINPFTWSWREKYMKKRWVSWVVGLGALLVVFAGITQAMADSYPLGGDEESVMGVKDTASFATEDWVGVQEEAPVVAKETPSFATEDWVPEIALSEGKRPVMEAMETPSFATEDWVPEIALSEGERPVMEAMETPSFATEDWVGASETALQAPMDWAAAFNEYYDVVETGALPSAVPREPWTGDNYSE